MAGKFKPWKPRPQPCPSVASHNYVVQMNRRDAMSAEITAEAKTSAFIAPLRFICLRPITNSAA